MKKYVSVLLPLLLLLTACGEQPEQDPVTKQGKLIKQIIVTERATDSLNENELDTLRLYSFAYDSKGEVCKLTSFEEEYFIEYDDKYDKVVMAAKTNGTKYIYTATTDAEGRVNRMTFATSIVGITNVHNFSYDEAGQLKKEDGIGKTWHYTWKDGNITNVTVKDDIDGSYINESTDYYYSPYKNQSNIDINWLLSNNYPGMSYFAGILGLLGKRSTHYAYPDLFDQEEIVEKYYSLPLPEDFKDVDIQTIRDYDKEKQKVDYTFNGDGLLTSITTEVPAYMTTIETTYTIRVRDYTSFVVINGVKHYYDVEFKSDIKATKRETLTYTFVKIKY